MMIAGLATMVFQGCGKDETLPLFPSVTTAVISDVTEVSATTGGKIELSGNSAVTESGICWNTAPNPTVEHNKVTAGQGSGTFTVSITGLKSGTTYFVRAYAVCTDGTSYGDQRSFTTDGQMSLTLPFVERFREMQFPPQYWQVIDYDGDGQEWYHYTSDFMGAGSASYSGRALDPYNFLISPKITILGANPKLEWNVGAFSANYPQDHYKVVVSTTKFTAGNCTSIGDVVFEETLTRAEGWTLKPRSVNLNAYAGKDVYIAWVHYDCSDEYGMVVTDVRIGSAEQPVVVHPPVLGNLSVGAVLPASATVTAIIAGDGGLSVVSRGFCYSTHPNPAITDDTVEVDFTASTVFTSFSEDLDLDAGQTYYVRAFAQNAVGVAYSNEQTIETPATVKTVLFFEDFATDPFDASGSLWVLIDKDGDGYNWTHFADDEDQCARSRSYYSGDALTPENYMVLPSVPIPADAELAELTFKVAASDGSDYEESYEVLLSFEPVTIDNCRDAQVIKPLETLPWENRGWRFTGRKVDLSPYIGQTIYILFVHKECSDQASFLLDDIEIASFK